MSRSLPPWCPWCFTLIVYDACQRPSSGQSGGTSVRVSTGPCRSESLVIITCVDKLLSTDSFPGFFSQRKLPTISRIMALKMPRASGSSSNPLSTTTTTIDLKGQSGSSSTLLLLRDRSIRTFPCSQTELRAIRGHLRDRQEDSPFSRQGESGSLRKMIRFLQVLPTRKTAMRKKLLKLKNTIIKHHL